MTFCDMCARLLIFLDFHHQICFVVIITKRYLKMKEVLKVTLEKVCTICIWDIPLRTSKKANIVIFYIILGHAIKNRK